MSDIPTEKIREIVQSSLSRWDILKKLGFKTGCSGQYGVLERVCADKNIDLSHLKPRIDIIKIKVEDKNEKIVADWLANVSGFIAVCKGWQMTLRAPLRNWLFKRAKFVCEKCGWAERHLQTGLIPLQIHHIDGDASHNRPENLQVLCPNCHSLTPNFGRRNKSMRLGRYADNS
jgi:Zn finger protein HypA/HybF involved in hydrogenase expression